MYIETFKVKTSFQVNGLNAYENTMSINIVASDRLNGVHFQIPFALPKPTNKFKDIKSIICVRYFSFRYTFI